MGDSSVGSDPEKITTARRSFLKIVIAAIAVLSGLILGAPFISTLISSISKKRKTDWSRVTSLNSLPEGRPIEVKFEALKEDAYHYSEVLSSVWVIKDSAEKITIFSPICTHLGCHFVWNTGTEHFECPCHASIFTLDGKVLSGPAPRPLDTLQYKIEDGFFFVRLERFKAGSPEKIPV